jgi:hypothetical protein
MEEDGYKTIQYPGPKLQNKVRLGNLEEDCHSDWKGKHWIRSIAKHTIAEWVKNEFFSCRGAHEKPRCDEGEAVERLLTLLWKK